MISQTAQASHDPLISLVPYQPSYNAALQELFYHTIHTINARDYIKEQLQAWAPAQEDPEVWHQRLYGSYALLAFDSEQHLLGFGNVVYPAPANEQSLVVSLLCNFNVAFATTKSKSLLATETQRPYASVTTSHVTTDNTAYTAHATPTVCTTATTTTTNTATTTTTITTSNIALLDYLYVNAANQGQHIGTQLCVALERYLLQHHCSFVLTHASLTAQGFFTKRGYTMLKKQQVERSEQLLDNALMAKRLTNSFAPIA